MAKSNVQPSADAIDAQIELHQAEQDERLRRLRKARVDALPWSVRKALRHLEHVRAKAEATPGFPVF